MGDLAKKAKNFKSRPEAKSQAKGSDTAGPNKTGPSNLHNVYDKYYKTIFSYSTLLEEFFQVFFPQLAKHVDFKKCKQLKKSTQVAPQIAHGILQWQK